MHGGLHLPLEFAAAWVAAAVWSLVFFGEHDGDDRFAGVTWSAEGF